jgi:hypothetical protein
MVGIDRRKEKMKEGKEHKMNIEASRHSTAAYFFN